jgi:coenzyme Q-binding protein COQ10
MPVHTEKYTMAHTAEHLYDLVADVGKYPEFLPWCLGARVFKNDGKVLMADLIVGYKMFREKFTSKVELDAPNTIEVTYLNGPMKYLHNHWGFTDNGDGTCTVDFHIDFEIRNKLFQKMMGGFFTEALERMVHAFEKRADEMYGSQQRLHKL